MLATLSFFYTVQSRAGERQGIKIGTGTIVDATIISAPPSTKNKDKRRHPEMHQTKKGNHGTLA